MKSIDSIVFNIDKYLNVLFDKHLQSQEDFIKKSDRLDEIKKMVRSDFYDMDLEAEPHYQRAIDKLNKDEFELMEKWLFQHPNNFDRERKRVYNEWFREYEKEKELNPFSEAYFLADNIRLIISVIIDSPMYEVIKNYITDFEQIDFKELAALSGKIDLYNYLVSESKIVAIDQHNEAIQKGKIKWTGDQTELITIFIDAEDLGLLKCSKVRLYKLINENFIDNDGKEFSVSYIEKLFKLSNKDERAKNRLDFSPFL